MIPGPEGRNILFCTLNGEMHLYDPEGIYLLRVPVYCLDEGTEGEQDHDMMLIN
jgi:hypothetical protein